MVQQLRPASFAQERLWFLDQLEPWNSSYNLVNVFRIHGLLDIDALKKAFGAILQRHESLRTTFISEDGQVRALVQTDAVPFELPVVNLDHLPEEQREEHVLRMAAEEGERHFDLSTGPLLILKLFRLSPAKHIVLSIMHHIITDGWSFNVLLKEMAEFYEAFHSNRRPQIAPLPMQYGDFASWQRESLTSEVMADRLEYWKQTLTGAPAVLQLPADRLRPTAQSHKGRKHSVQIDAKLAQDIVELGQKENATPFMVLLATFEVLLWRYTGVPDFVLGTPMAGRSHLELEPLIGLFVNTLPLRANVAGNPTFRELLQRVRDTTLDAFTHQDVPFETLVHELRLERSLSHSPLFQTMFIFHNTPRIAFDFDGLRLDELEVDPGVSKFDLTVEIYEDNGLCCSWEYNTDLFDGSRIARMAQHFETLLRGICGDPSRKLSDLPMLSARELNRLLVEWNATDAAFPDGISIHETFEYQAERTPDWPAVRSEERTLTYRQLNEEANCLAHFLRKWGVRPQDRVGVALERSADAIVVLLGVLKTGASYVPIDPGYPKQRIDFMLKDSGARVLVTEHRLRTRFPDYGGETVFIDHDSIHILGESRLNPRVPIECHWPAYVIYTSGSTGKPKGVLGTHRASMNRFAWMWKAYPFCAGEVCAHRTSLSFVDSVAEIFCPLLQGTPIFVVPDEAALDTEELVRQLAIQRITRMVMVPSQLAAILDRYPLSEAKLSMLRLCFSSGEALPYSLYERFRKLIPHAKLVNLYGSSEVAADVTYCDTSSTVPRGFVPIGKPIANVRMHVLDPNLNPVPIGVPGEIYAGGVCLAQGYLDRPELTAQRFIPDPFRPDALLYKTGDLGRYHEDGNIEYLGRCDNQIKIRGMRIELGEIEATLKTHASVRDAAVIVQTDRGNQLLVAYIVPVQGKTAVHSELTRHLKASLPDYMVPSAFFKMDALPMTPNGKLDQRAFPPFDPTQREPARVYVAPRNEVEEKLVEIWAEVLKIEQIGVLDNFFELGGHSLMAAQVIARIRKYLGVEVSVRSLFEDPTVAGLGSALANAPPVDTRPTPPIASVRSVQMTRKQLEAKLSELSAEEIDELLTRALANRGKGSSPAVN